MLSIPRGTAESLPLSLPPQLSLPLFLSQARLQLRVQPDWPHAVCFALQLAPTGPTVWFKDLGAAARMTDRGVPLRMHSVCVCVESQKINSNIFFIQLHKRVLQCMSHAWCMLRNCTHELPAGWKRGRTNWCMSCIICMTEQTCKAVYTRVPARKHMPYMWVERMYSMHACARVRLHACK